MQVVVVGSGAREHALAWRLEQSPGLTELHAAPGNPGIAAIGRCHPVRADDADGLLSLALTLKADLVVIGPEGPLVAGIADVLRRNGIAVFGHSAAAAQIEGSKTFAKDVLRAAGVPTAETLSVARAPCVVKADGLAAGKGVFVCRSAEEVDAALRAVAAFGGEFVIEELLDGEEVSLFALSDGAHAVPLGAAQDFKRAGDGDTGPNTGGMGAYSPVGWLEDADELVERVHQPVIDELARRGTPFAGCLFAGRRLSPERAQWVIVFLGVQLALSVFSRASYLFTRGVTNPTGVFPSDVMQMQNALFLPYWFWGLVCGGFSVLVLIYGVRTCWSR